MTITLELFSFSFNEFDISDLPVDVDKIINVKDLVIDETPEMTAMIGTSRTIQDSLFKRPSVIRFYTNTIKEPVIRLIADYSRQPIDRQVEWMPLSVAIGCSDGLHLSVAFTEVLANELMSEYSDKITVKKRHLSLEYRL